MYYFTAEFYNELLGYLEDDAELKATFSSFFTPNPTTGNYDCQNPTAYEAFLAELFADDPDSFSIWKTYSGWEQINSTQGGGVG